MLPAAFYSFWPLFFKYFFEFFVFNVTHTPGQLTAYFYGSKRTFKQLFYDILLFYDIYQ